MGLVLDLWLLVGGEGLCSKSTCSRQGLKYTCIGEDHNVLSASMPTNKGIQGLGFIGLLYKRNLIFLFARYTHNTVTYVQLLYPKGQSTK